MLIVLYTFDFGNDNFNYKMLEASMISVKRAFKEKAKIFLYTTQSERMKDLSEYGDIFEYIPNDHGHVGRAYGPNFGIISHSRVFLIPHLLKKYKTPILYLDNDTIIHRNFSVEELISSKKILGYIYERGNTVWSLAKYGVPKPNRKNITVVKKEFPAKIINNGVLFFPYNQESIVKAEFMIKSYYHLKAISDTPFLDMLAFSSICPETSTVYNVFGKNSIKHYYSCKKEKRIILEKLFDISFDVWDEVTHGWSI